MDRRRLAVAALLAISFAGCDEDNVRAPRVRRVKTSREGAGLSFESTASEKAPPPTLSEMVESGHHWRFATPHGPVHVWTPKGYNAKRAETIVYVHGFYVHVDDAYPAVGTLHVLGVADQRADDVESAESHQGESEQHRQQPDDGPDAHVHSPSR